MEASLLSQLILPVALFLMMLGIGITLRPTDFTRVFRAPRGLLLGTFAQVLLLPVLGLFVCWLFALPPPVAAGLMIITFAPGGATSNMITLVSRGDTALSVGLTALSSVMTPFTLPLFTAWMLVWIGIDTPLKEFPLLPSILKLAMVTLVPVLLGVYLRSYFPVICRRLEPWVKVLAVVGLALIVAAIVRANWERLPMLLGLYSPAVISLVLAAMLLGALLGRWARLDTAARKTLAIEVGIQNAGTALMVSSSLLGSAEMSAMVLIYGVLMQLPVVILMIHSNLPGRMRPLQTG